MKCNKCGGTQFKLFQLVKAFKVFNLGAAGEVSDEFSVSILEDEYQPTKAPFAMCDTCGKEFDEATIVNGVASFDMNQKD